MDDFRIKTSFRINHKRIKLQKLLGAEGVLALIDLWAFAAQERTDGDLSGMDDLDIEIAAGWNGQCGSMLSALLNLGFLEGENKRYFLHDWKEVNPYVYGHKERSKQAKKASEARWKNKRKRKVNAQKKKQQCAEHESAMLKDKNSNAPSPYPIPSPNGIGGMEDNSNSEENPGGLPLGEAPKTMTTEEGIAACREISNRIG